MGGLTYAMNIDLTGQHCPDSAFSDPQPPLQDAPPSYATFGGALLDSSADQPASPANTLTFTIDLTKCLASLGYTFSPGQTRSFDLTAETCGEDKCASGVSSGPDQTWQGLSFTRSS
jgi:hypothetical protein